MGQLPEVCMRCGAVSTQKLRHTFSWHAQGASSLNHAFGLVAVLVGAVVKGAFSKHMVVCVPLCEKHKDHWSTRSLLLWGYALTMALVYLGTGMLLFGNRNNGQHESETGTACLVTIFLTFVWVFLIRVVEHTAIRATEITESSISLTGVSRKFVEGLDQMVKERLNHPLLVELEEDPDSTS